MKTILVVALAALAAGCVDTTPAWQLEHDRIMAVRATPPHAPAGARIDLDVLVTAVGGAGPEVVAPLGVTVAPTNPPGFEGAVVHDAQGWAVIVPDDATLAAAREALQLEPTDPVPLELGLGLVVGESQLAAVKKVYLGDAADNPPLGDVTIDGQPAADGLAVPVGVETELVVDASDTDKVAWFTSLGDLTGSTAVTGYLTVKDPGDGFVAVTKRDDQGGVVWGYWTITAE